jgi:hypothetical protein
MKNQISKNSSNQAISGNRDLLLTPDLDKIKTRVLAKLLPAHSYSWIFSSFGILFFSLGAITISYFRGGMEKVLFLSLVGTIVFSLCLFSILAGIFLFSHADTHQSEWKERLGFDKQSP